MNDFHLLTECRFRCVLHPASRHKVFSIKLKHGRCAAHQSQLEAEKYKPGPWEHPIQAIRDRGEFLLTETAFQNRSSNFGIHKRKLWNKVERLLLNQDQLICHELFDSPSGKFKLLICAPKSEIMEVLKAHHSIVTAGH